MGLELLFITLADVFDAQNAMERAASAELRSAAKGATYDGLSVPLAQPFLDVMMAPDAHPVCRLIRQIPLAWVPPQTSQDPLYAQHSLPKAHVELVGPEGLVKSDVVRLGLYGILPDAEYGIRTHPAEEVFIMLAGEAYWKRGPAPYVLHGAGERSHHPSMLPHATRTAAKAFMSLYTWYGDIATDGYVYSGLPADG